MAEALEADQAAGVETGDATSFSSGEEMEEGSLASDETLQALRDKLTGE